MDHSKHHAGMSRLLTLPVELRLRIYEFLFDTNTVEVQYKLQTSSNSIYGHSTKTQHFLRPLDEDSKVELGSFRRALQGLRGYHRSHYPDPSFRTRTNIDQAILLANHQIYEEALPYASKTALYLDCQSSAALHFMSRLSKCLRLDITSLHFSETALRQQDPADLSVWDAVQGDNNQISVFERFMRNHLPSLSCIALEMGPTRYVDNNTMGIAVSRMSLAVGAIRDHFLAGRARYLTICYHDLGKHEAKLGSLPGLTCEGQGEMCTSIGVHDESLVGRRIKRREFEGTRPGIAGGASRTMVELCYYEQ